MNRSKLEGGMQVLDGLGSGYQGALFDPSTVAGLTAWYKANAESYANNRALGTNGDLLTDQSGSSHGATCHGNGGVIYKTNIVNGLAAYQYVSGPIGYSLAQANAGQSAYSPTGQLSVFGVFYPTNSTPLQGIVCNVKTGNPGGGFAVFKDATTNTIVVQACQSGTWGGAGTVGGGTQTVTVNTWNRFKLIIAASSISCTVNGVSTFSDGANGAIATGNNLVVGGYDPTDAGGITFPFDGYIPEVLVYTNAVSAGNQTNIENYLKAKYGLS